LIICIALIILFIVLRRRIQQRKNQGKIDSNVPLESVNSQYVTTAPSSASKVNKKIYYYLTVFSFYILR